MFERYSIGFVCFRVYGELGVFRVWGVRLWKHDGGGVFSGPPGVLGAAYWLCSKLPQHHTGISRLQCRSQPLHSSACVCGVSHPRTPYASFASLLRTYNLTATAGNLA